MFIIAWTVLGVLLLVAIVLIVIKHARDSKRRQVKQQSVTVQRPTWTWERSWYLSLTILRKCAVAIVLVIATTFIFWMFSDLFPQRWAEYQGKDGPVWFVIAGALIIGLVVTFLKGLPRWALVLPIVVMLFVSMVAPFYEEAALERRATALAQPNTPAHTQVSRSNCREGPLPHVLTKGARIEVNQAGNCQVRVHVDTGEVTVFDKQMGRIVTFTSTRMIPYQLEGTPRFVEVTAPKAAFYVTTCPNRTPGSNSKACN